MERYAKYRAQIKRMAPDQFASKKVTPEDEEAAKESSSMASVISTDDGLVGNGNTGPYSLYLKRRKRLFLIKIILFVVVVAAFVVWWFLLQGRK